MANSNWYVDKPDFIFKNESLKQLKLAKRTLFFLSFTVNGTEKIFYFIYIYIMKMNIIRKIHKSGITL